MYYIFMRVWNWLFFGYLNCALVLYHVQYICAVCSHIYIFWLFLLRTSISYVLYSCAVWDFYIIFILDCLYILLFACVA